MSLCFSIFQCLYAILLQLFSFHILFESIFVWKKTNPKILSILCNCSSKIFSEIMYFKDSFGKLSQLKTLGIGNIQWNCLSDRIKLHIKITFIIANCSVHCIQIFVSSCVMRACLKLLILLALSIFIYLFVTFLQGEPFISNPLE